MVVSWVKYLDRGRKEELVPIKSVSLLLLLLLLLLLPLHFLTIAAPASQPFAVV